jgi:hypothetical protein
MSRPHREVYVLGLHDRGVRRPASREADVSDGDLDDVGSGCISFAYVVGRPQKSWRGGGALP